MNENREHICQVNLDRYPSLVPPFVKLSDDKTLLSGVSECSQDQHLKLFFSYLEEGWIETQLAQAPIKWLAANIARILFSRKGRWITGITGIGNALTGACMLGKTVTNGHDDDYTERVIGVSLVGLGLIVAPINNSINLLGYILYGAIGSGSACAIYENYFLSE